MIGEIPGYDKWATKGPPETDHFEACPCADDADSVCKSCGHGCPEGAHHKGVCIDPAHLCEGFLADEDPPCKCDELED